MFEGIETEQVGMVASEAAQYADVSFLHSAVDFLWGTPAAVVASAFFLRSAFILFILHRANRNSVLFQDLHSQARAGHGPNIVHGFSFDPVSGRVISQPRVSTDALRNLLS